MVHTSDVKSFQLAASIGMALSAWSGFEVRLAHLFGLLSDMPDGAKAHALFDVINSFEVRFAMCGRLMEREELEPWEEQLWKRFAARVRKLHGKRHEVAHFSMIGEMRGDDVEDVRISPFFSNAKLVAGKARYLTSKQIMERSRQFDELREATVWFWHRGMLRRGAQELVGPSEEPALIARLSAESTQTSSDNGQ